MTEGPHRKPQFDIYSTMLIIAFVAMLIGTVFAYLEVSQYGNNKTKGAPRVSIIAPADLHSQLAHCTLENTHHDYILTKPNTGFGLFG
jgi:hypothetical protein